MSAIIALSYREKGASSSFGSGIYHCPTQLRGGKERVMVTKIKEVRAEPHDSSRYMLQEELTEVDIRNVTIFVSYLFPRSPISALAERWYIKCKMEYPAN